MLANNNSTKSSAVEIGNIVCRAYGMRDVKCKTPRLSTYYTAALKRQRIPERISTEQYHVNSTCIEVPG